MAAGRGPHAVSIHLDIPMSPEPWLRGPLPDVPPLLMPAAHALVHAREEVERAAAGLSEDELWTRPGGAASAGFHLAHIAGSIDRLLTYARGTQLDEAQREALAEEARLGETRPPLAVLVAHADAAVDDALAVIRATPEETLLEARAVGRHGLPTTVIGLLFHVAEHTQRHVGQLVTTAKIVRGLGGRDG